MGIDRDRSRHAIRSIAQRIMAHELVEGGVDIPGRQPLVKAYPVGKGAVIKLMDINEAWECFCRRRLDRAVFLV